MRLPPSVAALLAAAALIAGCSSGDDTEIATAPVTTGDVTEIVEAPATVAAKATTTLTAPASGTVADLTVRDGQRVRKGQVLLTIDSPSAEEQLEQARAADAEAAQAGQVSLSGVDLAGQQRRTERADRSFAAARAAAERIPDPALRSRSLSAVAAAEAEYAQAQEQARIAVQQFNDGLASLADALGSLSQAQRVQTRAAVAAAEQTVAALVIRAPISGTVSFGGGQNAGSGAAGPEDLAGLVGQLPEGAAGQASQLLGGGAGGSGGAATQGQLAPGLPVQAGQQLLAVVDVSALSLVAEVDETDVLLVRPGVRADVELDAVPNASYAATVSSIDLAPTTSTRGGVAYRVRLALGGGTTIDGGPAPEPRPGMSAVADLRVRSANDAVAVPAAAIVRDGQRDSVWVVDDGVVRRRPVRLGAQGDETVQVVDGLRIGQTIVVRGADRVEEGQEISS